MEKENKEPEFDYVENEIPDKLLVEKKLHLMRCKLAKKQNDIKLSELEEQLDQKLPQRLLNDSIERLKTDIKNKQIRNNGVLTEATESELDLMKIQLKSMQRLSKEGCYVDSLRIDIQELINGRERYDSPEQQIKKLEREIKTKKEVRPVLKQKTPIGVG